MLGVALYLSVAHAPGFSPDTTHHFADTTTIQVEYRYGVLTGGSRTFTFECVGETSRFVEVLVPASDRSTLTIEFTEGTLLKVDVQTSCAPHQYHEGFTMTYGNLVT